MPDDLTPIQQWRRNNPDPRLEGRTDEEVARALYQVRGYGERGIDENEFLSRVGAMPSADVAAEPEPETQGDDPGFQMPGLRDMLNTAVATSPLARFAASERLTPEEQEVHAERTLQNATRRRDNILGTPVAPEGMTDDQFRLATGMYREQYDALPESSPERARVDRLVAEQLQAIEREDPERARVRQALGAEQQALIDRVNAGERAQLSSRGDALLGVPRGGVNALIGTAGTIASANEQVYSGLLGRDVAPSETLGYRLSSQAQDFVTGATFKDPMRAHEIPSQVGEAGGQMALIAGTGPIAGTAIGAGMSSDALTRDAVESGANPMQQRISQLGGAALGLTERLVPEGFEQAGRSIANPIMRRATSGATGFVLETGQEGGQSAGQNYIANTLAGYDPDRPTMSGVRDAMIVGGLVGGIAGTVFSGAPAQDDPVANMDDNTLLQTRQQLAQGRNEVWSAQRASGGSTADAVNATAPIVTQLAALDAELERRGVQVPEDPINPLNTDISVQDIATGQEPEVFTRQVTGAARRQAERNNRKKPRLDSAESAVQKIEEDLAGLRSRLSSARQAIRGASDPEAAADAALAIEREIARLIDLQSEIANIENAPDNETPAEAQARVARVKQEIQRINDNGSTQARLERELVEAAPQLSRPQAAAVGEALSLPTNHLVGLGVPEREALASNLQFVGAELGGAEPQAARTLNQFVGVNALTADKNALARAYERVERGEDPEQVRAELGWFQGVDGKWRFEISDQDAVLLRNKQDFEAGVAEPGMSAMPGEFRGTLEQILQHEGLFNAYPKMRGLPVRLTLNNDEPGTSGLFDPGRGAIEVRGNSLDGIKSVLLHEVQHAVQQVEGYARGGSVNEAAAENERVVLNAINTISPIKEGPVGQRLDKQIADVASGVETDAFLLLNLRRNMTSPDWLVRRKSSIEQMAEMLVRSDGISMSDARAKINGAVEQIEKSAAFQNYNDEVQKILRDVDPVTRLDPNRPDTAYERYERRAGEAEARDTQARANLSDAGRAANTPQSITGATDNTAYDMKSPFRPEQQIVVAQSVPSRYRNEPDPVELDPVPEGMFDDARQEAVGSERAGDGGRRDPGRSLAPLEGAPTVEGAAGPDPRLVSVAERYAQQNGIDLKRQAEFVKVDEARAERIAQAYEAMPHAPNDPAVREAYADLIRQTMAQYQALVDAGYSFTFFDSQSDPYGGNPWNAMRDLRANQTMAVYGTYDGYGTDGITDSARDDNPMLADTGLRWPDQAGIEREVTANDLFRAVHDAFGHGLEGAGFRARGEENAWQAHVRLFTGPAVGAITSETRGQNSWLNFGPYGETNRTAGIEDTVFAEQKTGLMPEWTWTEGRADDMAESRELFQSETTSGLGSHLVGASRRQRVQGNDVVISRDEETRIKQNAKRLKLDPAEIRAHVERRKAAHPVSEGWVEWVYNRSDVNDKGKVTHYAVQVPYAYHTDADGKPFRPTDEGRAAAVSALARKLADEVATVKKRAEENDRAAIVILRQSGWYKEMRIRLRREFGGMGDLFADLLGATSPNTPVRDNWNNAVEALRLATRGDFDNLIEQWEQFYDNVDAMEGQLATYVAEQQQAGLTKKAIKASPEYLQRLDAVRAARTFPDELLPKKSNGNNYGFNGRNVARAMVDLWRVVKNANPDIGRGSTKPKALNFSGNLIGFRQRATIDVWAARLLQRLAKGNRLPSEAEASVKGDMKQDGSTTGMFGFGQDVFSEAVALIRKQNPDDELLSSINDDDLQAVAWFLEKEIWTLDNATNAAGEGGSFEFEADLAGNPDRERIDELRRVIGSSLSTPEQKQEALAELQGMQREVDRFYAGLSIEQSAETQGIDFKPTDGQMVEVSERIRSAIYANDSTEAVVGSKVMSTEGRYGDPERAFDVEFSTRNDYDATGLMAELERIAAENRQDSFFLSRVLEANAQIDPLRHRPGVEIYFREGASIEELQPMLDRLAEAGAQYYTVVVDGRSTSGSRAGAMPKAVGVRLQYVPEFDARYGDPDTNSTLTDEQIEAKVREAATGMKEMAAAVAEIDGVSFSDVMWYETQVKFSHQYGAQDVNRSERDDAGRVSEGVDQGAGGQAWTGQLVREGLEAAERQSDLANNGRAFEASDRWVESWQQPEGGRELNQEERAPRGSILIPQAGVTADQPVLIKMGKAADITTAIHEGGHYWLEHYREMAQRHDGVRQFYGEMAQAFGFDADPNAVIPTEAHEAFARGAEQFFAEGEAPTPGLQRIFEQFRNWMKAMYDALIAGGNIDLTPERRDIYKQMFGTEPSSQILPRLRRVNVPDNVRQRPAGGIPMADDFDGPITGERLGDMAREIGEMAGFPVREGRLQSSKALGQYNTRSGVIRLRLPEDFTTLVHEIGHALAFKHRDRYRRVMDAVKAEGALLPLTMDVATDPKTMEDEAFAELARTYIEAPAWLETTAPQGLEAFEKEFGEVAPDLLGLMRDLSVRYEAFLNQPSTAAIAGDMVSQGGANGFRGLARDMATKLKAASNSQGLMALSDKIYTSTFDKTTPIARFMERMDQIYEDRTGRRLKVRPSKDARILSRLAANGANTARVWMMEGVIPAGKIDPEGASLADGLQLALGDQVFKEWNAGAVAEFGSYLMSRRMVDEYARWNRGELKRTPDKFTLGEHRQNIKDLEFRNPTFRQAAELIFEWNDNLLKLKRDRGLISQEQFERFQAAHPHYVPLARDVRSGTQGGTGSLNKGPISKRFKGSDRSVINPIESMMRDANQTAQAIWRNETIGAMYDAAQKAGPEAGAWLEELPANEQDAQKVDLKEAYTNAARAADVDERDAALILEAMDQSLDGYTMATIYRMKEARERGEPVIYLWRNGERKMLRLGDTEQAKATYQAITSLGVGEQSYVLLDWMSLPSQFLVGAVTNHPLFVMMNWQRDQLQNWALSDNGFLPGLSGAVGAARAARGGVTENRALAFGGTMAGVGASIQRRNVGDQNSWQGFNRNAKLDINDLRKKGYKLRELASWRGIGTALDITESGSRFENASLYFKKAKKAGMSDEDAIVWAMFEANDTMDFSRRGIVFYWMNRFIPFWNAAAQGTEKGLRVATGGSSLRQIHRLMRPIFFGKPMNFTAQEKRDAARALKLWGKLSIMTLPSLAMMLLYHDDPEFQEFSEYIRATRWLFKVNGEWLMIPKPFELATPANILERGMEAQLWEDPTAFDRATRSLMFTMMPPLENPMITTGAELVANKDLYTGAPIVPDDLVGETPEMQYTERTSAYARVLGNVFGVSPLKIEHVVNSFTGNWSRDISLAGDLFDPDSPEKKLTEQFFIRGLFRNPQSGAVTRDDFWNQMSRTGGRLQAVASRYRGFAQEGDAAGGIDYLRSLDPIEARFALSQVHGVRGAGLPPMYRASHPMAVAQPVMVMNGRMRRDLRNNELTRAGTRDRIELAARDRGRAIAILDRLNGIEALDALRLSGFEAYQNRPGFDRAGQMELLREISPQLAREYEMRRSSATGFMYANTENVERVWSNAEREIDRILQDPDRLQGLIRMREAQRLRSEMPG